ncbi:MAG: DUF4760 domain-containing protein [Clostridia bacterium]|nr:DUF4760 domain-containing protein [Clostridia bacterium]
MKSSDVISLIALVFSIISGAISLLAYIKSIKRQKIIDTIEAYRTLQSEVLDKFVSYKKSDVLTLLENLDEPKIKEAYDDCRAMVAKIEHFAVGVNHNIYDLKTTDKLGGVHLIYLFGRVEPLINHIRNLQDESERPFYCEFEKMINTLSENHPECVFKKI